MKLKVAFLMEGQFFLYIFIIVQLIKECQNLLKKICVYVNLYILYKERDKLGSSLKIYYIKLKLANIYTILTVVEI